MLNDFNWIVVYKDNSCLRECNLDGTTNLYKDIDRKNCGYFNLYYPSVIQAIRTAYLVKQGIVLEDALVPSGVIDGSELQRYYDFVRRLCPEEDIPSFSSFQENLPQCFPSYDFRFPKGMLDWERTSFVVALDLQDPCRRLIWRKRRFQRAIEKTPFKTIYLVGWQATLDGKNVQSILYIYPDGKIELSDSKSDLELFDFEQEGEDEWPLTPRPLQPTA